MPYHEDMVSIAMCMIINMSEYYWVVGKDKSTIY